MPTAYTSLLGLALPVTGELSGTWGTVVNNEITSLVEDAIANAASISVTSGNVTLTDNNGSSDQSRMAILLVTGSPGVSRNIVAPSTSKWYIVKNSSNAEIVLKGSATTGVTIPAGAEAFAFWNGSDFELAAMIGPSSSTDNAVARFDGTTGKVVQNSAVTIADTTGDITTGGYVFTAAGAAGTPAYSTSGDTNTGMWFPAADTIAFSEGGTQAMTLDSSGNLAVGTTSTARGRVHAHATTNAQFVATDSTLGADYGGVFRGYGTVGVGGFAEIGVLDNNVYTKGVVVAQNSDNIQFFTGTTGGGSTVKMQLTSSGNLGLGVTPSAWVSGSTGLQIGSVGYTALSQATGGDSNLTSNVYLSAAGTWTAIASLGASRYQLDFGAHRWFTASSGTAGNTISFTQAMTLDSSGNLLVGATSLAFAEKFQMYGNYAVFNNASYTGFIGQGSSLGTGTASDFAIRSSNALAFLAGGATERARITSGGDLLVGTTSNYGGRRLDLRGTNGGYISSITNSNASPSGLQIYYDSATPNGTGNYFLHCSDATTERMYIRSNGGISNYSGNDTNLSDRREKTNFAPAGEYLSKICAIPVQTFNYIDQNIEDDPGLTLGVVAQDVQKIAPELVMESNWGTEYNPKIRLSVYQTDLQYALMKCIQELKSELDTVKAELASLKGA